MGWRQKFTKARYRLNEDNLDPTKMYFYTDGCLKQNFGSWSVIGIKHNGLGWEVVFTASDENIPARDSGQMELHALRVALENIIAAYPDEKVVMRTDHQGHAKTINEYLSCYKHAYQGVNGEQNAADHINSIRQRYANTHPKDYGHLFDLLDEVAKKGRHHVNAFGLEWVPRESDQWIKQADSDARAANPAFR